ncbi:hypothetical protein O9H85_12630 [Paenibacillus filicis]|uniref:Uncharacterized protein n=1 Tax=Paenibacillus gyeongsangnamensis TaxID=3388067 RepID=A0ABT4Q8V3_9BACL|nr:hypothetical protein [Paenibacillus filicis]MCZ8513254.1 hypothetical protein [Paenibacillus filicis]
MAGNEQNIVSHGLNAANANAEDQESQQQVQELANQLNSQTGAAQTETDEAADANME